MTFNDVTLAGSVSETYQLRFGVAGDALTPDISDNVTVTAGAATQVVITTQPVGGASGALLTTQPIVEIQDAQGNTVTSDGATQVTVTISSGAGGTLGGTTTRTAVDGIVTFDDLTLSGTVGENYQLRFGVAGDVLTPDISDNVTVT